LDRVSEATPPAAHRDGGIDLAEETLEGPIVKLGAESGIQTNLGRIAAE
jgi:hypothetical protein